MRGEERNSETIGTESFNHSWTSLQHREGVMLYSLHWANAEMSFCNYLKKYINIYNVYFNGRVQLVVMYIENLVNPYTAPSLSSGRMADLVSRYSTTEAVSIQNTQGHIPNLDANNKDLSAVKKVSRLLELGECICSSLCLFVYLFDLNWRCLGTLMETNEDQINVLEEFSEVGPIFILTPWRSSVKNSLEFILDTENNSWQKLYQQKLSNVYWLHL